MAEITHVRANTESLTSIAAALDNDAKTLENVLKNGLDDMNELSKTWQGPRASRFMKKYPPIVRDLIPKVTQMIELTENLKIAAEEYANLEGSLPVVVREALGAPQ